MWKLMNEEIDLNNVYYPQDGVLEIKVHETNGEYTKVEVFENDRPYCYTRSGCVYLDQDGYIRMADGINVFTPANREYCIAILNSIGKRVDVSKYAKSHL